MRRDPDGADVTAALDDLILGRGVSRGRHDLRVNGRDVTDSFLRRLAANGFRPMTVREAPVEPGVRIPGFLVENGRADFGYFRWEIFTPRSRRKLFASEYRRPDNHEWAVQVNLGSTQKIWANPDLKQVHEVEVVVPVIR